MPFINSVTNKKLSDNQRLELKKGFGSAIESIGKSENWLMVNIQDQCDMYFKGQNGFDMIYVEVSLLGKASSELYSACTEKLTEIIEKSIDILPENIYIKYSETDYWGWNGSNF